MHLDLTLNGLNQTDTPLVMLTNYSYGMAGFPDDQGIYYFAPLIAKFFGISINLAIDLFLGGLLLIGALTSICIFFFIFKHWSSRLVSTIGITLLTIFAARCSDVYICGFFAVVFLVPFFIYCDKISAKFNTMFSILLALSGIVIGYSNQIRIHTGTGIFLFIVPWILLNGRFLLKEKIFSILILTIFTSIPYIHFRLLERQRNKFLNENISLQYDKHVIHPKWHNIYIGFGYLENPYGIKYDDQISYKKVESINPNALKDLTGEYEQILKNECIHIMANDFLFFCKTILAKSLSLLIKALIFFNFGIIFCFYLKPQIKTILPYIISASFYSLPGILTMPFSIYVLGMLSLVAILGIFLIGSGLEKMKEIFLSPILSAR